MVKKDLILVKGTITRFRFETGYKGKGDKRWNISIKVEGGVTEDIRNEILQATKMSSDGTFTPKWLKEDGDYINLHTSYEIPVQMKGTNGKTFPLKMEEVFEGAEGTLAIKCKENAVYPSALQITKNGEPYNPFECFE